MSISEKLEAMARLVEMVGFTPHTLMNSQGNICFVEAMVRIEDFNDYYPLDALTNAVPMTTTGYSSVVQWAIDHNLTTGEAISFIREVAKFYE